MEVKSRANVSSLARLAITKERTRIMGKRRQPNDGDDLEKAAEQWQRQKEREKRGILGTKPRSTSR